MEILKSSKGFKTSGNKQSIIDWSQGNRLKDIRGQYLPMAVDMVAKCVGFYRSKNKGIKAIYLCPAYYNQFDYWWRSCALEQEADSKVELLTFDGVEILQMDSDHIYKNAHGSDLFDWQLFE